MSLITGFFDGTTLRAANLEGLFVQNDKTKYWQLKHGRAVMPFPHTIHLLKDQYVVFTIYCVASQHISINHTTKKVIYDCPGSPKGKITIYKAGPNVHSVAFDGYLFKTSDCNWGLKDPDNSPMPIGVAFRNVNSRLVFMGVESIYSAMPSILDCRKQVIYP